MIPGPERGNVIYKVSIQGINQPNSSSSAFTFGTVEMCFDIPATVGSANECDQHKTHPVDGAMLTITCTITGVLMRTHTILCMVRNEIALCGPRY